jgi:pimeloyl-ACP methyl ester carboxylesterase
MPARDEGPLRQRLLAGLDQVAARLERLGGKPLGEQDTKAALVSPVIHGDDDQIVPIDDSGRLTAQVVEGAELRFYPGASHGLFATHAEQFNRDLLDFGTT